MCAAGEEQTGLLLEAEAGGLWLLQARGNETAAVQGRDTSHLGDEQGLGVFLPKGMNAPPRGTNGPSSRTGKTKGEKQCKASFYNLLGLNFGGADVEVWAPR